MVMFLFFQKKLTDHHRIPTVSHLVRKKTCKNELKIIL